MRLKCPPGYKQCPKCNDSHHDPHVVPEPGFELVLEWAAPPGSEASINTNYRKIPCDECESSDIDGCIPITIEGDTNGNS